MSYCCLSFLQLLLSSCFFSVFLEGGVGWGGVAFSIILRIFWIVRECRNWRQTRKKSLKKCALTTRLVTNERWTHISLRSLRIQRFALLLQRFKPMFCLVDSVVERLNACSDRKLSGFAPHALLFCTHCR